MGREDDKWKSYFQLFSKALKNITHRSGGFKIDAGKELLFFLLWLNQMYSLNKADLNKADLSMLCMNFKWKDTTFKNILSSELKMHAAIMTVAQQLGQKTR